MKIRLITFHTPKNYGAVLQGYSLYSYLRKYSDDVEVIDYNTKHLRYLYKVIKKPTSLRSLALFILGLPYINSQKHKCKKFDEFVSSYYSLTKRYETTDDLYHDPPQADICFTGSDQVFNPNRIIDERKAFYLDFLLEHTPKCSYAASFGIKQIPADKKDEIRSYLNRFSGISIREESGVKIVREIGGKEAVQVLDPVFLNDKDFWHKIETPYKKEFKHYLFYYRLMGARTSDDVAFRIAKEKNMELVVMTGNVMKRPARNVLWDVGPQEFLYLLSHAEFVVTDSFHGVAFSIIFQKQFIFSDVNAVTKERGYDLLKRCEIEKVACADSYQINSSAINYDYVSKKLDIYISNSKAYITKCIGEVMSLE